MLLFKDELGDLAWRLHPLTFLDAATPTEPPDHPDAPLGCPPGRLCVPEGAQQASMLDLSRNIEPKETRSGVTQPPSQAPLPLNAVNLAD